jgi:hypothetical protein
MLLVRPVEPPRWAINLVFTGPLVVAEKLKPTIHSLVHLNPTTTPLGAALTALWGQSNVGIALCRWARHNGSGNPSRFHG